MREVEVEVTQDDISNGVPAYPCACPVAIAMKRVLGTEVSVGLTRWRYGKDAITEDAYKPLPREVGNWISDFDRLLLVSPIKFKISVPE